MTGSCISSVDFESAHRSIEPVRGLVREVAETGAFPFVIGGDHALMYPDVAALADVYGKGKVGVVHFNAHYDAGRYGIGHNLTHGNPVRRLIEQGHVNGNNFIQVATTSWPKSSAMVVDPSYVTPLVATGACGRSSPA